MITLEIKPLIKLSLDFPLLTDLVTVEIFPVLVSLESGYPIHFGTQSAFKNWDQLVVVSVLKDIKL